MSTVLEVITDAVCALPGGVDNQVRKQLEIARRIVVLESEGPTALDRLVVCAHNRRIMMARR